MNYINTTTLQRLSEQDIRNAYPNTSFAVPFTPPDGYAVVFPAPVPTYDQITQGVREIAPVLTSKGTWEQAYEVYALDAATVTSNQAAKAAADAKLVADKIEALWKSADGYVSGYISGVAIGLLTLGVVQSKPKALAVQTWSGNIWAEYYNRKALVTTTSQDNHDFSTFGPMPYSVPELRAELGL